MKALLSLAGLCLLVLTACSGSSSGDGASSDAALTALKGGFPAPPAELPRAAAYDPANLSVPGGQWDQGRPSSHVSLEHNEAVMEPDYSGAGAALSGLSYAQYPVLIEDYAGEATIDFNFGTQIPAAGNCFIGLARPVERRWDWIPLPEDTELRLASFDPYRFDDGTLLITVALAGTTAHRLYSFQVGPYTQPGDLPLDTITLPPGFSISVFAYPVPNAREMCLSPAGTLFAGSNSAGVVYAISDYDSNGVADDIRVVASSLNQPVGVDMKDGDLYFSQVSQIWRIPDVESDLDNPPAPELVFGGYPTETHHGWKFIRFGPDGRLYVPVGAPCNICDPGDPYANITRMHADMQGFDIIARGIRNTVGFDWNPATGELWFTDNGRDDWGPDTAGTSNNPPCEFNRIAVGAVNPHYGYPYYHGMSQPDPDGYANGKDAADYIEPAQPLGTHVAPLGIRFYTGSMFPAEYQGDAFIAEHGSWNRTPPLGARVSRIRISSDAHSSEGYEIFADGWQYPDGSRWGRPADVLVMPDGALLVSDDQAGAVYRISYSQ